MKKAVPLPIISCQVRHPFHKRGCQYITGLNLVTAIYNKSFLKFNAFQFDFFKVPGKRRKQFGKEMYLRVLTAPYKVRPWKFLLKSAIKKSP
jgi:hypothetical protein